jgi:hypothetical protein
MARDRALVPLIRIAIDALPPGEGRTLPHNGYLPQDLAAAEAKGYKPVDVRWEKGQHRVDLIGQGIIIGSVVLNPMQMDAYESEVRLYKEVRPVEKPPSQLTGTIQDRLADFIPGKLAAKLQAQPATAGSSPQDPVRKLTEPKGEAELALADEVKQLMENQ